MKEEFSTLLADVKEQILYLQELGVENFEVDLPEINSFKFQVSSSKLEIPRERLEKFVPADEVLKSVAVNPKAENEETKTARRSLLESTKLSRLPSLSKRNT